MSRLLLIASFMFASLGVWAQVTTSSLSGMVTDTKGEALPGATIVATHTPSGTNYGTVSLASGKYTIPGMRVGGPYTVKVSFVGYKDQTFEDIYLSLGVAANVNAQLPDVSTELSEVVITSSRNDIFSSDRTGAASNINNRTIQSVPTISRGLRDFSKLSPFANTAGNGTSFAGTSNRYNQFAIDGLVSNDVFGLSPSGTNGGQTGIEPISLDAIEEFTLNIAPYDVRQSGFTGGGINAVTRSGSNTFQGSAYYFGNNQSLVGKNNPNTNVEAKYPDYTDYQAGFRVGGPIIKNKLFFFVNGEITRQKTPLAFEPGTPESNITVDEVNRALFTLGQIAPGYDPGSYQGISDETNSNKFLVKLDWNISSKHKLSVRHSYTYGENIDNSRTPNQLRFYNNGVYFPSTTNSTGIELNSIFGSGISNRLLVGYTRVRDDREPLGNPFPYTLINLGAAPTGRTIIFGGENSSVANQLDQDITTITDDVTLFKGNHTLTFGTHNEIYSFYNLFVQNIFGNYAFKTLEDFETQASATPVAPTFYQIGYSFADDGAYQTSGGASFKALQLGLYAQDEFQATQNVKVTAGLRLDLPIFPDSPEANDDFNNKYGSEGMTGEVPETRILWSPRVGFNWDVNGDKTTQVRGGTGLFTGRVPFVWVSNQYSNNGMLNGTYSTGSSASSANPLTNGIKYSTDPFNQPTAEDIGATPGRGAINVIANNFKFPQVFRSNVAVDQRLPGGLVATVEAIFNKTLNNVNFTNLNRVQQEGFVLAGVDTRPRYTTTSTSPTNSGYNSAARVDGTYDEIIKIENTNKGYTYNFMVQLVKELEHGFSGSIAYSYGDSYDLNSGTSSVAYSNWRFANNVNGLNALPNTRSNYSPGSRVVGLVSYRKEYLDNHMATQISLFYNGQSGQAISYRYNGDLNYDGTSNDLIYVPASQSEINLVSYTVGSGADQKTVTPDEQWAQLDAFIQGDKYLNERRGEYAERNGSRMPFQHQFDLRILQEFAIKAGNSSNKLQLSFDILNVGNMLNKDWGRQYLLANQEFALINYLGLTDSDPTAGVNYSSNTPRFTYNPALTNGDAWSASDLLSRWRAQFGIRYIFN
ncbi:carboxypeptidase regulatory-like domain-containing protein [Chryseolinea sp. T2]|uniref:TonB-dependent receptor n=1 Tax=Chryseolinea sp. T2 TaxID=3129255 RepID=UPI003077E8D9